AIVRREGSRYRTLVHSQWNAGNSRYRLPWVPPAGLADSLAAGHAVTTGLLRDENGIEYVRATAPIARASGTIAGTVVAELRSTEFLDGLTTKFLMLLPYALVAFLLGLAVSFFPARHLTRGLKRVSQHATSVAQGTLRAELDFSSTDEVGQLATAVREMTVSLRTLLREIDAGAAEVAATAEELAADAS